MFKMIEIASEDVVDHLVDNTSCILPHVDRFFLFYEKIQ